MFFGKISLLLVLSTTFALSSIAQQTPNDLRGLIGIRASSGEMELQSRGDVFIKTGGVENRKWVNYWNGSRQQCIAVETANGRFSTIEAAPMVECGRGSSGSGANAVTVYEDNDLRGRSQTFTDGRYLNNRGQLGNLRNDRASSVEVPVGFSVRLCDAEGSGYGLGTCLVFGPGKHDLPYTLDNRVSYVEVSQILWGGGTGVEVGPQVPANPGPGRNGVTVYDDRNFRGTSQSFAVGKYLHQAGQFGALRNDEASSVVVPTGLRVRLCENEGAYGYGGGRCEEYGFGRFNLRYNDDVSFIEVTRASTPPIWGGGATGSILPVNVNDLIGIRASSGESEMRSRGFRLVDSLRSGSTTYTIWWRAQSRQCIQAATANGRYDSVTDIRNHPKCY